VSQFRYLKLRRQGWYARLSVPAALRGTLGRGEWVQSLGTRDLREANRRKHAVLAELQRKIHRAAFEAQLPPAVAGFVMQEARRQRRKVERGQVGLREAEHHLHQRVDQAVGPAGHSRRGAQVTAGTSADRERLFALADRVLNDEPVTSLRKAVRTYLVEISPHVRRQTLREKERCLDALMQWLGRDSEVIALTRRVAGQYLTEQLAQRALSPKTQKDIVSNLSAFWNWLEGRGFAEQNPWRGMSRNLKNPTRGTRPHRRAWKLEELNRLLVGLPTHDPLFALCVIALYSGLRREEIAGLRTDDIEDQCLVVKEGKTRAALRRVPIHSALQPLIEQLVRTATEAFLIPGLLGGGADHKRGHYIGKRFGHVIRNLGLNDPALVFHSLRHTFIQKCEEAGVPEFTAKLLVGHSRWGSLTYGNRGRAYSTGVSLETLRREIAKLSYGELDGYMLAKAAMVRIETVSKPRRRSVLQGMRKDTSASHTRDANGHRPGGLK
jgi:integrase